MLQGDRKAFYFNTWKDVVIPGLEADQQFWGEESRQELVTNPPHRRYIAYFRGTIFHREGNAYSRGLRPRLHALFQNQSDIIYGTKQKDCDRKVRSQTNAAYVVFEFPIFSMGRPQRYL